MYNSIGVFSIGGTFFSNALGTTNNGMYSKCSRVTIQELAEWQPNSNCADLVPKANQWNHQMHIPNSSSLDFSRAKRNRWHPRYYFFWLAATVQIPLSSSRLRYLSPDGNQVWQTIIKTRKSKLVTRQLTYASRAYVRVITEKAKCTIGFFTPRTMAMKSFPGSKSDYDLCWKKVIKAKHYFFAVQTEILTFSGCWWVVGNSKSESRRMSDMAILP